MARSKTLTPQKVDLIAARLDQKSDPKTAPLGRVMQATNCVRQKSGEYRKRFGKEALSTSGTPAGTLPNVWQLGTHKGSLISLSKVGNNSLWSYSETVNRWAAPGVGTPYMIRALQRGPITSKLHRVVAEDAIDQQPDIAVLPGTSIAIGVYRDNALSSFIEYGLDLATGTKIWANTITNGAHPRVEAITGHAYVVYQNTGTNALTIRHFATSTNDHITGSPGLTYANFVTLSADNRIATHVYGTALMVAVYTAVPDVKIYSYFSDDSVSTASITCDANLALGWLLDSGGSGRRYLASAGTTDGVVVKVISGTTVTNTHTMTTAPMASVRNITGYTQTSDTSGSFVVVWDVAAVAVYNDTIWVADRTLGVITTENRWIRSLGLRSKCFLQGTDHFVVTTYGSATQPTYFVHRIEAYSASMIRAPLTKIHRWIGNGRTEHDSSLTNITAYGSNWIGALTRRLPTLVANNTATGIDVVELVINATDTGRPVEAADVMLVPQGQLCHYDGRNYSELNFPVYPEQVTITGAAGGSLIAGGTYSYVIVYKHTDAQGRIHRSTPSVIKTAALGGANQTADLTLPTLRFSGRIPFAGSVSDVQIEVYRGTSNTTSPLYYLTSVNNSTSADTVSFSDTTSDANLTGSSTTFFIYTNGGVLENHAPPQFRAITLHRGRVWGIDADDPRVLWYSKEIVDGLSVEFNEAFTVRLDDDWGECTALASMDGHLIVCKRDAIYSLPAGDGPSNLGQGLFPRPYRTAAGVGTVQPRSVVVGADGLYFQSKKGLRRLTRGLQDEFIGAEIEDHLGTATVIDAVHVDDQNQIRFYTNGTYCLVWDYFFNEWFTWTGQTANAACKMGTLVYQAHSPAVVSKDSTTLYTDNGGGYAMEIESTWIAMGGIAGFQRVWQLGFLGTHVAAHYVHLHLAWDYVDTFTKYQIEGAAPWEWNHKPSRQKCAAIKFKLIDAQNTSDYSLNTTGAFRFGGSTAIVGVKGGINRRGTSNRINDLTIAA